MRVAKRSAGRVIEFAAETLALHEMSNPMAALKDAAKWVGQTPEESAQLLSEALELLKEAA